MLQLSGVPLLCRHSLEAELCIAPAACCRYSSFSQATFVGKLCCAYYLSPDSVAYQIATGNYHGLVLDSTGSAALSKVSRTCVRWFSTLCQARGWVNFCMSQAPLHAGSRLGPEGSGQRAEWMDPTRSEDIPVQEVGALKKRLVASERDRKQALAEAAAENRALQLKLQVTLRHTHTHHGKSQHLGTVFYYSFDA